jgi:hypothetical protein
MQYPKRSDKVYVEALEEELCVYDWEDQRMHALNPTAALVWDQCDGQTSPETMAARLEQELNVPDANKLVWLSLDRLEKAGLLARKPDRSQLDRRKFTRRELLKVAGLSLALLPVVKSIVLPTPAQAQCSPNCIFDVPRSPMAGCDQACPPPPREVTFCSASEIDLGGGQPGCECRYYIPPGIDVECLPNGEPQSQDAGWD